MKINSAYSFIDEMKKCKYRISTFDGLKVIGFLILLNVDYDITLWHLTVSLIFTHNVFYDKNSSVK